MYMYKAFAAHTCISYGRGSTEGEYLTNRLFNAIINTMNATK